jgi:aryl-alcohol dehydrogenase-like predicted oxidoreductase
MPPENSSLLSTLSDNRDRGRMQSRQLGSLRVSSIGLGCMGLTPIYGNPDPALAIKTIHRCAELGVTLLDTSDAYGKGENQKLVGRAIAGRRDRYVISTKFGNLRTPDGKPAVNGRPEYVVQACDESLKRLGIDAIDLYFQHRVDPSVPVEDTVGAMGRLVQQGKVRHIGLSEAAPARIRKAHATFPITALQTEYSLATREVEHEILGVCEELGIGFVAYGVVGRGLLTGTIETGSALDKDDIRLDMPRFQGANREKNLALVARLKQLADAEGCTPSQLAIAWVLSRRDWIVPIVGTSKPQRLEENAAAASLQISAATLWALEQAFPIGAVVGARTVPELLPRLGL